MNFIEKIWFFQFNNYFCTAYFNLTRYKVLEDVFINPNFYIMKIKFVFALAAVAVLSLASCKKDYTCDCVTKMEGFADQEASYPIKDAKKKDAEDACDKLQVSSMVTCTLK